MKEKQTEIEIYDKEEKVTTTFLVEEISENRFKLLENDFFHSRFNLGTEIETRINSEGKYEFVRILKESEFITRRILSKKMHLATRSSLETLSFSPQKLQLPKSNLEKSNLRTCGKLAKIITFAPKILISFE